MILVGIWVFHFHLIMLHVPSFPSHAPFFFFFLQYWDKGSLRFLSGFLFAKKLYPPNLLLLTPHIFKPTGSLEYKLSVPHLVRCSISGENFFHVWLPLGLLCAYFYVFVYSLNVFSANHVSRNQECCSQ